MSGGRTGKHSLCLTKLYAHCVEVERVAEHTSFKEMSAKKIWENMYLSLSTIYLRVNHIHPVVQIINMVLSFVRRLTPTINPICLQ